MVTIKLTKRQLDLALLAVIVLRNEAAQKGKRGDVVDLVGVERALENGIND